MRGLFVIVLMSTATAAGGDDPLARLPAGFPRPAVPEINPITSEKVELGRHLFFDERLSADGTFSCSTCHAPAHAFTDARPRSVGVTGEIHPRGAMSLANVAYNVSLNWADPTTEWLEEQMPVPMFSVSPVEMGITGHEEEVLGRLRAEPIYTALFEKAFPGAEDPVTFDNVVFAIASFERTLVSGDSPYDRYIYWDDASEFPPSARRGMELFFSDRLSCAQCHAGFNLSGPVVWEGGPPIEPRFHNTALYDLDGEGAYPSDNPGLFEHTRGPADMGRFRAPTLRNIAVTAPYMHDGSLETLEAVVDHYAAGGRAAQNPLKSDLLHGFELSPQEQLDLIRFLESLTDTTFLSDPQFSDPWSSP